MLHILVRPQERVGPKRHCWTSQQWHPALPMKLYSRTNVGQAPLDQFDRWQPQEIVTTHEIRELPNGAFYPTRTVLEVSYRDADAPKFTEAEWLEVRAGKRKEPLVAHRRYTWECKVAEIPPKFEDGFFVIPFPDGQQLFDHDAGKMIGGLDPKPLVKVGQQAPPLAIARWLDGKQRTLEDLKGQAVVLDFWGLWCGACRSSVPKLKAIQETFRDRPVTFISIHSAEKDPKALAARITEFNAKHDWNFIAAIDAGRMLEDSVTTNAYGIPSFPMLVIIGPDGKIAYTDDSPEGPECSETNPKLLAEWQQTCDAFLKKRFAAVGETWPLAEGLDEKQQAAIHERVELAFIKLQIESALKQGR